MWQSLFSLTNGIAVIAWAVLILAPRRPLPLTLVLYAGVGLLCLIYAALLLALIGGWADAGGEGPAPALEYSVAGLRALFRSDGGLVVGWTHYLALDLFTGLWLARDGDSKRIGRLVQTPVLLATFVAGPLGLLAWLAVREPAARRLSKQESRR
jgi:hypothetical protein